jgi:XRE family transcriptional regulator, fatty acid utilization regulator
MGDSLDPLTFGRRLRHHRKARGMTLQQLGAEVGRPAPFLSMLENGRRAPRPEQVADLARAMGIPVEELTEPQAPSRRAELEIELERMQADPRFQHVALPYVRPSPSLSDEVLQHLVGLYQLAAASGAPEPEREDLRRANAAVGRWLRAADGYLPDVETVAAGALERVGHQGDGPLPSRALLDIAADLGFQIEAVEDMIPGVRSVTDTLHGRIYIAQRNELRTRQARKAILQTLAGRLLGHTDPVDTEDYLRQRVETAYLAAAILAPEPSVADRLRHDRADRDVSVEDVKESYYVSYEMAAWRVANLATHHLGLPTHLIVSDDQGTVVKGYANDGLPFLTDPAGNVEAQPLCRRWAALAVFDSEDKFDVHAQYTDTPTGTYFCVTHLEPDRPYAVTLGVPFEGAQWLRGRDTSRRATSACPDPTCCRRPTADQAAHWDGHLEVSVRAQQRLLGRLATDPLPSPRDRRVYDLAERHRP